MKAPVSVPGFLDYQREVRSIEAMAVETNWAANLTGEGEPARIPGARVTGRFFTTLAVPAQVGRTLLAGRGQRRARARRGAQLWPLAAAVRLVSLVVGRSLSLNGESYEVVGVMPRGFSDVQNRNVELWAPLVFRPDQMTDDQRTHEFLNLVARVRRGVPVEQTAAEVHTLAEQLKRQYPDQYSTDWGLVTTPSRSISSATCGPRSSSCSAPWASCCSSRAPTWPTVARARGRARSKEIAVRTALGAAGIASCASCSPRACCWRSSAAWWDSSSPSGACAPSWPSIPPIFHESRKSAWMGVGALHAARFGDDRPALRARARRAHGHQRSARHAQGRRSRLRGRPRRSGTASHAGHRRGRPRAHVADGGWAPDQELRAPAGRRSGIRARSPVDVQSGAPTGPLPVGYLAGGVLRPGGAGARVRPGGAGRGGHVGHAVRRRLVHGRLRDRGIPAASEAGRAVGGHPDRESGLLRDPGHSPPARTAARRPGSRRGARGRGGRRGVRAPVLVPRGPDWKAVHLRTAGRRRRHLVARVDHRRRRRGPHEAGRPRCREQDPALFGVPPDAAGHAHVRRPHRRRPRAVRERGPARGPVGGPGPAPLRASTRWTS